MNSLPVEVITHVLRFVNVSDRKEAALVCRKWYEASLDPMLLRDTIVTFHAPLTTSDVFHELGRRKTPHLVLDEIDGSFSSKTFLLNSCKHLTENLQSITLKGSNITESLFTELMARCSSLQTVDISLCNSLFMSGQLLSKDEDKARLRRSLANVKELNVSSIRYLSDATLNRILHVCPNVQKLYLSGNKIIFHSESYYGGSGGSGGASTSLLTFSTIVQCVQQRRASITALHLSRTSVHDDALGELARIPGLTLQALHLVCCRDVSSAGVVALVKAQQQLVTLDLSQCVELDDAALHAICQHLPHLRHLYMNKCRLLTDAPVRNLHMLHKLETLQLASNYVITAPALSSGVCSGKVSRLRHLNVSCCTALLGDSFIVNACRALGSTLVVADFSSGSITDVGLQYICTHMTSLKSLILKWNSDVSDDGLLAAPLDIDVEQHLKHAALGKCKCARSKMGENILDLPQIKVANTAGAISESLGVPNAAPITNLKCLQLLDLSSCPRITDASLKQFAFTDMRVLRLQSNPAVTDEGLKAIASTLVSLEELDVSQCREVSDAGLIPVVRKLRRLRSLSLAHCDRVTDRFLQASHTYCSRLKQLDVSLCGGLSMQMVDTMEANMPHLVSVNKRLVM